MRIEDLWTSLRAQKSDAQQRVDSGHPLDLYADFEQPDKPALVLFTDEQPSDPPTLKAICIRRGQRTDGRWYLRVVLEEGRLLTVFAELCRDIISETRSLNSLQSPSAVVLSRIARWQDLLQAQAVGLSKDALRGLLGELFVLKDHVIAQLGSDAGVSAWTGPMRTKQDFSLPDGTKIEVKTSHPGSAQVQINGLEQLDAGGDPLKLVLVTLQETGQQADQAVTPGRLVDEIRSIVGEGSARRSFEQLLVFAGWTEEQDRDRLCVRRRNMEVFDVGETFPRLIRRNVDPGIVDATYTIARHAFGDGHE